MEKVYELLNVFLMQKNVMTIFQTKILLNNLINFNF
jgi:hypothetical protein